MIHCQKIFLILLICLLSAGFTSSFGQSQSSGDPHDSASAASDTADTELDTAALYRTAASPLYTSVIISGDKPVWYDIEQWKKSENKAWIFVVLLLLLILLTVLKLSFHADFENLFRVFANAHIASQIGRNTDDFTLSSLFMRLIFIAAMSMLTRFVILHFYPQSVMHRNLSIVIVVFLFTFFSVAKYLLLKYIGSIFEIASTIDEYIFNLSAISRTIGISMIPVLFMMYSSPDKYFNYIFAISLVLLCFGVVMIVARGLSTAYKLMYNSVYHFLIYICIVEILPIFLFIKLLTKTVI